MRRGEKWVAGGSLVLLVGPVVLYLWWGRFQYYYRFWQVVTYGLVLGSLLGGHLFFRDSWARLGFCRNRLLSDFCWYLTRSLPAAALMALAGLSWGQFSFPGWKSLYIYANWAAIQQYLLQNSLRLRAEQLWQALGLPHPAWAPALFAGSLFGLLHLPNYPLAGLTWLGGSLWCLAFVRRPSFPGVWASHLLLASVFLLFFKSTALEQFQVGLQGQRFTAYGDGVQVGGGYDSQGEVFVATLPGADREQPALVRIFDGEGVFQREWLAFPRGSYSGVLSVGSLEAIHGDVVAVAQGPGPDNTSHIRIFDASGRLIREFVARELPQGYGAWLAIGCGRLYLSPGPGPGHPQIVLETDPNGSVLRHWEFRDTGWKNGLRVTAVCDRGEQKLLLWGTPLSSNDSRVVVYHVETGKSESFPTFPTTFGLNLTPLRLRGGVVGLAAGPGPLRGYPPWIRIYDLKGVLQNDFAGSLESSPGCGQRLAAADLSGDGVGELILGEGSCPGQPSRVQIFTQDGQLLRSWLAYP